jgi:acyl carrier protein
MTTLQTQIRQFVIDNFLFGQTDKQLGNSDSFLESGIIDSTGVLELIAFLESKFAISIGDDELVPANLDSVERVSGFVERKLAMKAASESTGVA